MGCFIAPASAAIVTTVLRKKFPDHWHVGWLNTMMWGGAIGLIVDHIMNREIVPWFPFLTAMSSPAGTAAMLKEIVTVGIPITLALVFAWIVMVIVYENFISTPRASATARTAAK